MGLEEGCRMKGHRAFRAAVLIAFAFPVYAAEHGSGPTLGGSAGFWFDVGRGKAFEWNFLDRGALKRELTAFGPVFAFTESKEVWWASGQLRADSREAPNPRRFSYWECTARCERVRLVALGVEVGSCTESQTQVGAIGDTRVSVPLPTRSYRCSVTNLGEFELVPADIVQAFLRDATRRTAGASPSLATKERLPDGSCREDSDCPGLDVCAFKSKKEKVGECKGPPPEYRYFPVMKGSRYEYKGIGSAVVEVTSAYLNQGHFLESLKLADPAAGEIVTDVLYGRSPAGVTAHRTLVRSPLGEAGTESSEELLRFPLKAGSRWTLSNGDVYVIGATGLTVNVPAGVFKDCVRVDVLLSGKFTPRRWFAPGVGLVKDALLGELVRVEGLDPPTQ
jgi:hypothetical protein